MNSRLKVFSWTRMVLLALLVTGGLFGSASVDAAVNRMPDPSDFTQGDRVYLVAASYDGVSYLLDAPDSRVRVFTKNPTGIVRVHHGGHCPGSGIDTNSSTSHTSYFQMYKLSADESFHAPLTSVVRTGYGTGVFGSYENTQLSCGWSDMHYDLNIGGPAQKSSIPGHEDYYVFEIQTLYIGTGGWNQFQYEVASGDYISYFSKSGVKFGLKAQGLGVPGTAGDFTLKFAPDCTVAAATTARLEWFDPDAGQANQAYQNPVVTKLYRINRETDARTLQQTINISDGDSAANGVDISVDPLYKYEWVWENIYSANGIQFELPYDSVNYYLGCDTLEFQHTVYHGRGSPVEVEIGDEVTVWANVCNAGEGQYYPEASGAPDLAIRIEKPRIIGLSKSFDYVSQTNAGHHTNENVDGGDARWTITQHGAGPDDFDNHATPLPNSDGPCTGWGSGGRGKFEATYRVPSTAIPGEEYCFWAVVGPGRGIGGVNSRAFAPNDPAADPPAVPNPNVVNSYGSRSCFKVINKPFYKVENGHIWAGALFASQIGSCEAADITSYLSSNPYTIPERGSVRGHNKTLLGRSVGASGDQGIFALGHAAIVSAGTQRVGAGTGEESGAGLIFANSGPSLPSKWFNAPYDIYRGAFHNGYGPTSTTMLQPPKCVEDYYEAVLEEKSDSITEISGRTFNISPSRDGGVYHYIGSQPLQIDSTTGHKLKERTTIIAQTDVIIRDDIIAEAAKVDASGELNIPNLTVITKGGNIKIRHRDSSGDSDSYVKTIDARLIALPDAAGSGGNVYTCVGNPPTFNPIFELDVDICAEPLTINGQVVAKNVYLLRTGGTQYGLYQLSNSSDTPTYVQRSYATEVIDYTPEQLFMSHIIGGKTGVTATGSRDDIKTPTILNRRELPPIY